MHTERLMIFVDGLNLYGMLKEQNRTTAISYDRLAKMICGNRNLVRLYFYAAEYKATNDINRYKKQQQFFDHLKSIPYCNVRLGHMVYRNGAFLEKGVDVLLTVDMVRLARLNSYDTAVLVSGDCDFVEAVKEVRDLGKRVELVCLNSASLDLRRVCNKTIPITDTMLDLCYKGKKELPVMKEIAPSLAAYCVRRTIEEF